MTEDGPGRDLRAPAATIVIEGLPFVAMTLLAAGLSPAGELRSPSAVLLLLLVWASARASHFAPYLDEHRPDRGHRFSGPRPAIGWPLRHERR